MSNTDIAYGIIGLHNCYAMSGTDIAPSGIGLRNGYAKSAYAMSGTAQRMVVPAYVMSGTAG
eukprot:3477842-Rhodomonas_salina.2